MTDLIGRTLDGKVELKGLIGEGGMGAVYRGRQLHFDREVAVKILKPQFLNSEDLVRRFYREAKSAGRLRSRHVITIYDYGRVPEGAYIIMELSSGKSLGDLLADEQLLSAERSVLICSQVLSALSEAHPLGIVHRDLKTDNVLIEKDYAGNDFALVLDFGIAKLEGSRSVETLAGSVFGTPTYMAPEQCRGEVADARSDIYAVGVMLYELIAGTPPLNGRTSTEILLAHVKEKPAPLLGKRPDLSPALSNVVMKMLEKSRDDRPQSADAAIAFLLEALDGVKRAQKPQAPKPHASPFEETMADLSPPVVPKKRAVSSTLPPENVARVVRQKTLEKIAETLTETLGPVSQLVVAKEIAKLVKQGQDLRENQLDQLVERLSLRVTDDEKRQVFLKNVRLALAKSGRSVR